MSNTMRVLVYDGPHAFHIEERPRPEPGPGEVRLRIAFVGICGSDLHGYTGESGRRVPGMVMGHEASGWIEAVGSGVGHLKIGEQVTFNPSLPCGGECGHVVDNHCTRLQVIGVTPHIQGAFADAAVVPANRVVPIGDLDLVRGAVVEPMAVALQATRRVGVGEGDAVVILGGGMIGQCIAQAARLAGAGSITVSEGREERRDLAEAAGFRTVTPDQVPDLARFDRAFDAVGTTDTAAASIRAVGKGGTVCFVGLGFPYVTIPLFDVVVSERSIVGSFCYTDKVFKETVGHIAEGRLNPEPYLGATERFEDIWAAFEDLATGIRTEVKIMMTTNAAPPEVPT